MALLSVCGQYARSYYWTGDRGEVATFAALALVGAAALAFRAGRPDVRSAVDGLGWGLLSAVLHILFIEFGARGVVFPLVEKGAGLILSVFGTGGPAAEGGIVIRHGDGTLHLRATIDKLDLPSYLLASLICIAFVGLRRRDLLRPALVASLFLIGCTVQFAFGIVQTLSIADVLSAPRPSWVLSFASIPVTAISIGIIATVIHSVPAIAGDLSTGLRPTRKGAARMGLLHGAQIVLGSALLICAWIQPFSGSERSGRVLIDDSLSGSWGPAARRLDFDWYGDFATYGFASATEFLSHDFSVSVNIDRPFTDDLFQEVDVLVLKTSGRPIPDSELLAIERFVRRGGGLFLVSDHTNLLGMSSNLNRIASKAGMRFRFDAVSDGTTGGFSEYHRPYLGAIHPISRRVYSMQFMTGCSIEVSGSARPVLVQDNQTCDPIDWAGSSYFGNLRAPPDREQGLVAHAAVGRLGRGRVVCFSDSTVLSSFALFLFQRSELLVDTIAYLNRSSPPVFLIPLLVCLGIIGMLAGLLGNLRNSMTGSLSLDLGFALLLGVIGGQGVCSWVVMQRYVGVQPDSRAPRIAVAMGGNEIELPPVLGTPENIDLSRSYDTWYAAIARSGVFPLAVQHPLGGFGCRAIWIMNPRWLLLPEDHIRIARWVEAGGSLIISFRTDRFYPDAIQAYLNPFGSEIHFDRASGSIEIDGMERLPLESPHHEVYRFAAGRGQVLLVTGAECWARDRIGHCFSVPDADMRDSYAMIRQLIELCPGLVPKDRRTYGFLEGK